MQFSVLFDQLVGAEISGRPGTFVLPLQREPEDCSARRASPAVPKAWASVVVVGQRLSDLCMTVAALIVGILMHLYISGSEEKSRITSD
jgi:hypothetical protein